jgi:hypothetical protein
MNRPRTQRKKKEASAKNKKQLSSFKLPTTAGSLRHRSAAADIIDFPATKIPPISPFYSSLKTKKSHSYCTKD